MTPQHQDAATLLLGLLVSAGYSAYLASNPEAMQSQKLETVALREYVRAYGMRIYRGWVFFPKDIYREVTISVMGMTRSGFWSGGRAVPIKKINLPWVPLPRPGSDVWVEHGIPPWKLPK